LHKRTFHGFISSVRHLKKEDEWALSNFLVIYDFRKQLNEILHSAHMLIYEDIHPKLIKLIRELWTIITPSPQWEVLPFQSR